MSRRTLWSVPTIVAFVLCGLIVAIEIAVGFFLQPASVFLAVLPLLAVGGAVLWLGRFSGLHKTEWAWLFLFGSVIAAGAAGVLNVLAQLLVFRDEGVAAVVVAPVVEESLKLLGVVLLLRVLRRGEVLRLVAAGCAVAVGFAFTENIGYFAAESDLFALFVSRAVLSPFAHPLFTGVSCVGLALYHKTGKPSRLVCLVGLAMLGHASWNFFAVYHDGEYMGRYFIYLALPAFVAFAGGMLRLRARARKAQARQLATS
jgi:RsiW-degrading membrane proteinase PrsW (M82 family)